MRRRRREQAGGGIAAGRQNAGTQQAPQAAAVLGGRPVFLSQRRFRSAMLSVKENPLLDGLGPMHANATTDNEVTILARLLGNDQEQLPRELARYLLTLGFNERDKARMHSLAVRNQEDALPPAEKEELLAYAKAGTVLSILKSKARRVLKIKPKKRTTS
jgi:hypothetical protein